MGLLARLLLLFALLGPSAAWCGMRDATPTALPRAPTWSGSGQVRRAVDGPVASDPATLCESAVNTAEHVHRLPPRLLAAISVTETGRADGLTGRLRPWPWSINALGEGRFFATKQQAMTAVAALEAQGVRSIDVGCLQVNLMYHPHAFVSLAAAFDPEGNASYAARFLNELHSTTKDWTHAIAAYHSETPALGEPYRVLVEARWQRHGMDPARETGVYQAFGREEGKNNQVYGAFAPRSLAYRAFSAR